MTKLEQELNIAINSFSEGLENKQATIANITGYIKENFIPKEQIEQLPAGLKFAISKANAYTGRS